MAKKTNEQLERELAEALAKILSLEVNITTLEGNITTLEGSLATATASIERYKNEEAGVLEANREFSEENDRLNARITNLERQLRLMDQAVSEFPESVILEKVRAGLSRDQALEVLTRQRAEDEAAAEAAE